MITRFLLIFVLLLPCAYAGEVLVFLLAGQSNMQGLGQIADLPTDWLEPDSQTYFWNGHGGNAWEPLILGQTQLSTRAGEFGPEVGLARGLRGSEHFAEDALYLVKVHFSGMPLNPGWDGNEWINGGNGPNRRNFYPGESADDPMRGTLYVHMIKEFRAALAAIEAAGDTPVVQGLVWMQGEQDAKNETSADEYGQRLVELRSRTAEDLGLDELPLVFGQVLPQAGDIERFVAWELIRQRMAEIDHLAEGVHAVAGIGMVPTDDFPVIADHVHFSTEGQMALGEAFAVKLLELGPGQATPKEEGSD